MELSPRDILVISVLGGYVLMAIPWIGNRIRRMNENNRKKRKRDQDK